MVTFGRRAAERKAEQIQRSNRAFINRFKDKETKLRFVWEREAFLGVAKHFDAAAKISFPCAEEAGQDFCVGCASPHEKTREKSFKYIFPAYVTIEGQDGTARDVVRIYECGVQLWGDLETPTSLFGTITDRDYAVVKRQTGERKNDIRYNAVGITQPYTRGKEDDIREAWAPLGAAYQRLAKLQSERVGQSSPVYQSVLSEIEDYRPAFEAANAAAEVPNLQEMLKASYGEALEKLGYDAVEHQAAQQTPEAPAAPEPDPWAAQSPKAGTPAGDPGDRLLENAKTDSTVAVAEREDVPDFRAMPTPEIRKWLDSKQIDYPANAPRGRLVAEAERAALGF